MLKPRIIPCLLIKNKGLTKTINFDNPTYIGDPINTVKIFNEKEVDEIIFLDIEASKDNISPDFELIKDVDVLDCTLHGSDFSDHQHHYQRVKNLEKELNIKIT